MTPSQLGLALGLIAEVAHKARHDEEVGEVADSLLDVAEQMAEMIDGLDQHGKHLATAFKSYDRLVGDDQHPRQALAQGVDRLGLRPPRAEAPKAKCARSIRRARTPARSPSAGARPRASSRPTVLHLPPDQERGNPDASRRPR